MAKSKDLPFVVPGPGQFVADKDGNAVSPSGLLAPDVQQEQPKAQAKQDDGKKDDSK